MCSHGFEKTGPLDYCKLSEDGETKIIVRSPNMINGFYIGAQFADYGEYDSTFKKAVYVIMNMNCCCAMPAPKNIPTATLVML